jgi:cell division protein FtsI/penicillin-binding protein 2
MPHAWFAGFAPYQSPTDQGSTDQATPQRRLSFAVVVEHGGYGGRIAAPIAREVMEAAKELGLL